MYKVDNFWNLSSVGVLCRGKSLKYVGEAQHLFEHCFIVGQFENALKRIGKHLKNQKIVQVVNKSTIQTKKSVCQKYGIVDVQCNFDGWKTREISVNKKALFKKIVRANPWMTVHLAPPGIRERRGETVDWATTGIYTIDLAAFLQVKKIVVVGLDFYESDYFISERVKASYKTNRKRSKEMRKYFNAIVDRDKQIEFVVYTSSKRLKEKENLSIVRT